jgi:hypothetical protein
MKPSGDCSAAHENKSETTLDAERCNSRCTETAGRADELARLVALVAQLPGTDDDRARLLAAAVELLDK